MIPLPSLSETIAPVAEALDQTSFEERVNWMRGLGKKELVALWKLTEGRAVPADYFDSPEVVIHEGQNSLLLFNQFQKRIVRFGDQIQGYNHQTMAWITGPGHFYVHPGDGASYFDYTRLVPKAPDAFPPVADNMAGFSRFVYGNTIDKLHRVSEKSVIGAAFRNDKPIGAYFMLQKP